MKSRKSEPTIDGRAITGARELRDPRSREYAVQTMFSLKRFLETNTFNAKYVERELEEIKTYKHWEVLGFETLDDYLKAELGVNQRQLRSRLAKDLAADPDVKKLADRGTNQHTRGGSNRNSSGGTNANYIVRRLKRDAPEIAEALARGEFPSARAAARAAGFIYKEPTPLEKIRKLLPKLTAEERDIVHELTAPVAQQQ